MNSHHSAVSDRLNDLAALVDIVVRTVVARTVQTGTPS